MSKADEVRAKAQRLNRPRPAETAEIEPISGTELIAKEAAAEAAAIAEKPRRRTTAGPPATAPKARPVRVTTDFAPVRHAQLRAWLAETAVELGVTRVTSQDLIITMVSRLLTDETFARKMRADLQVTLNQ